MSKFTCLQLQRCIRCRFPLVFSSDPLSIRTLWFRRRIFFKWKMKEVQSYRVQTTNEFETPNRSNSRTATTMHAKTHQFNVAHSISGVTVFGTIWNCSRYFSYFGRSDYMSWLQKIKRNTIVEENRWRDTVTPKKEKPRNGFIFIHIENSYNVNLILRFIRLVIGILSICRVNAVCFHLLSRKMCGKLCAPQ